MSALTQWSPFRKTQRKDEWGTLAQWNPLREMEQIQNRIDKMFQAWPEFKEPLTTADWSPLVDIMEDDKEHLVKMDLPDIKKEDIEVIVHEGEIRIRGERKTEKEEKGKKFHRLERSYGSFERSFTLPQEVDASKVTSEFKDGVLRVHLPKGPEARPEAINIKIQ